MWPDWCSKSCRLYLIPLAMHCAASQNQSMNKEISKSSKLLQRVNIFDSVKAAKQVFEKQNNLVLIPATSKGCLLIGFILKSL